MKRFLAILRARNIEFARDRSALTWNILLPVLLIFGFSFLFSGNQKSSYKVGVFGHGATISEAFLKVNYVDFVPVLDLEKAIEKVRHHQLDMLVDLDRASRYWINSNAAKGYLLERIMWGTLLEPSAQKPLRQTVEGREIRYVDWVLPGILSMNMMFSCLFGIGYVIVRYRKNGVLKRLKATPVSAFEFITAQVISRLMIIMAITVSVFTGCNYFIDFYMQGSYWTLLLIFVIGGICLISVGLVMASRTTSEEFAGGILNLISWPMMILSGVWFSLEGTHPFIVSISKLFPLTHIIDAARAVMNDGATIVDIGPQLIILSIMSVVLLVIGSLTFKWE